MSECLISVAVRCRPDPATSPLVQFTDTMIAIRGISFVFDQVFANSSNEEVYASTVGPKLDSFFKGINLTILAYGATGSGKTHTMGTKCGEVGDDVEPGLIHHTVQEIYRKIGEDPESYGVKISFIEIYGEEIYDLLRPSRTPLGQIRQYRDGFRVPNVLELKVSSPEDVFQALRRGCSVRHTSATARNRKSSRSHAVFTIILEHIKESTVIRRSKFLLVDLAGSERIGTSLTLGEQMREGIGINRGLMYLRGVVKALAKHELPPYRECKLTKILQDSLESSIVIQIACIYPIHENLDESLSTIRYASMASGVIIKTKLAAMTPAGQIIYLTKQVAELQEALKNRRFDGRPSDYSTSDAATSTSPSESGDPYYFKYICLQHKVAELEEKIEKLTKQRREVCSKLRKAELVYRTDRGYEKTIELVDHFVDDVLANILKILNSSTEEATTDELSENVDPADAPQSSKNTEPAEEDEGTSLNDTEDSDALTEQLDEIAEMMSSNADAVKELENLAKGAEAVDQDIVSSLVKQIEKLTEEKDKLQMIVNTTVDGKEQEKIDQLIEEINTLKADLKAKKVILKQKEANKTEINRLMKENNNLKQIKVSLLKKIKEAGTKFSNLNFEKKKEITKILKDSRKMQVEKNRIVTKLEKEINVLQRKLSTVSRKTSPPVRPPISRKLPSPKESLEARIKDSLENILSKKLTEILNKKTEEEVKSVLPNLEQYKSDAELNLDSEEHQRFQEKIEAAKFYVDTVMAKTSGEIKDQRSNIDDTVMNLLNSLSSVSDAKQGISVLIKEFLSTYEKMTLENDEKYNKVEEELHSNELKFNTELNSLYDQIQKVTEEKREVITINKTLVDQVESLSIQLESIKTLEGEPQLVEKIQMQESIISELRAVVETYKKKDSEIQSLSKDLFRAKKGKSTPWLGPVPLRIPSQKEDDQQTLMDEFLDESLDESFIDDKDDPDWRGTPMYKRNKEKLVRKMPASDDDDSPPTKKSTIGGCSCTSGCKTMRCGCRKSKFDCSIECACKTKCFNSPNTSSK